MQLNKTLSYSFILLFSVLSYSQITVDDSLTTEQLVEEVLFNSGCVDLSNFSQSTGTDFGEVNGIGAFDANGSDFPYQTGVILSSGSVLNAPGPNLTLHSDGTTSWPGDADLEANTTATNTNNASYIQFDFVPLINQISFNFLLASEEYNQNFECTYSDAFAFILIDQETNTTQNLAVLPGTNIPIEVTNIHPEVPGQCPAINEEYFDKYNFLPFNDENEAAIDFNGQIVSLVAIGDVVVGNNYTIKLVIADETDTALDSAVFIEAGSFNIGNVDLGIDIIPDNGNSVCEGDVITLDAGDTPDALYQWFKDDVELVGETNNTLDVFTDGLYRVDVTFAQGSDCVASDEIVVVFFKNPEFDLGEDIIICDGESVILDATISNQSEITNLAYTWYKDGVEIIGETDSTLTVTESGLYSVDVNGDGCIITDEVNVLIQLFLVTLGNDIALCDEDSIILTPVITGDDGLDATYLWSTGETTESITVTQEGVYSVEVTINGCTESASIVIFLGTTPVIDLGEDFSTCPNELHIITAVIDGTNFTFEWYLNSELLEDETENSIEIILEEGTFGTQIYEVIVSDGFCTATSSIEVSLYDVESCIITQGITPNGDSLNDELDLEFLNDRTGISKLQIFNRYGTLVYEKNNYVNGWFGQTNDGDELPTGTYFYVLDLLGEDSVYGSQPTGWIYLNRNAN